MNDFKEIAKGFASQLLVRLKDKLDDNWDELESVAKDQIRAALQDIAELTIRQLGGEDVTKELKHARARASNWAFVGSSLVKKALQEALAEAGVFLAGVLKGLLTK